MRIGLVVLLIGCGSPQPPASPPALRLSLDGGQLAAATFDAGTSTFSFSTGLWLQQIQVAIDPSDPDSSVTVANTDVPAGTPSPPIPLALGLTSIAISIDGTDFHLDVTRGDRVTQRIRLQASNGEPYDGFGYAVALDGDTLVVGAADEGSAATGVNGDQTDNSAPQAGAAYVFHRDGDSWVQEAYLKPSNTKTFDTFGAAVAIWGDTIAVGAFQEPSGATGVNGDQTDTSAQASGAVYVFVRDNGVWSQQAFIKASNTESVDDFGMPIALWGDTLVVAALHEDSGATGVDGNQADNSVVNSGAVYVFVRDNGVWSQQAYVKASNTEYSDYFGYSVAVWGDTIAVGAMFEDGGSAGINGDDSDNSVDDSGAVYVFRRTGTTWAQEAYVKASNPTIVAAFGQAVALWHDTLAVGAPGVGTVYVFAHDDRGWSQQAVVTGFNTVAGDEFGGSLSLFGDMLAVGARLEDGSATGVNPADGTVDDDNLMDAGAVYTFRRQDGTWMPQSYVKALQPCTSCYLATSVALWGDTLATGTYVENTSTGAAYVFQ
jgi:hypothetical protein